MLKNKLLSKKSIISTWLISYILVLVLPIFISGIMYIRVEKIVKNEVGNANRLFLNEIKQNIDGINYEIDKICTNVAFNYNVKNILKFSENISNEEYYNVYETIKDLKTLGLKLNSIDKFYIYLKQSDLIVDEVSFYSPKSFYDIYCSSGDMSYIDWCNAISKEHKGEYITLDNGLKDKLEMYYIKSIPIQPQGKILGNIVLNINEDKFVQLKKHLEELNGGHFLIIDNENKLIGNSSINLENAINYNQLRDENGYANIKINNKKMFVFYTTSNINKWKYVYCMPNDVFLTKINYARKIFFLSIFICFTLGIITVIFLLKFNYAPLKKLLIGIGSNVEEDKDNDFNEYTIIEKAIEEMAIQSKSINEKLSIQKLVLKSRFIDKLLKNNDGYVEINDSLNFFDINFVSNKFCVVTFFIEEFYDHFYKESNENYREAFQLVQFAINNTLEDIAGDSAIVLVTEMDDMIVAILNIKDEYSDNGVQHVKKICFELKEFVEQHFKIKFSMAISNIHNSIEKIPIAYKESMDAIEYKLIMSAEEIIAFDEIKADKNSQLYYPLNKEEQFINYIKLGQAEKANSIINDIFNKNFEERTLSKDMTKSLIFNFISVIIKAANNLRESNEREVLFDINELELIAKHKSINKIKNDLNNIVIKLCSNVVVEHKTNNNPISNNVKEYIEKNYTNENLSIASIAEYFKLHPSYISTVFKTQVGEGILDYINKVRVNRAKEIMKEQKSNLEDLSKVVGYSSVRTFTRAFSKLEGITPGKYKDMI